MIPPIPPAYIPYAVGGVAMLMLAIWLIALDPASPLNRAFSLLLALRGATTMASVGINTWAGVDGQVVTSFFAWAPYWTLPVAATLVYFLSVYPVRRGLARTRWGPAALAAVTLAAMLWYMADHSAYLTVHMTAAGVALEGGPLFIFGSLVKPMFALAAFVLARDYRLNPHGSQGYSTFLIAAAFAINALVDGMSWVIPFVHAWVQGGLAGVQASYFAGDVTFALFAIASLPIGIMAVVEMARAIRHERDDATLQEARRFITVVAPVAVLTAVAASVFAIRGHQLVYDFIHASWRLVVPAMITYSLLRFSLFDADIRLKAGVRRAIVMVSFAIAFFLVSEAAEALLQRDRNALVGIAGAALIALAARPMHAVAHRAADALMPDTRPLNAMSPREREVLYHDQYMLVGQDRVFTDKERRMLDNLAAALGLSPRVASELETTEPVFTDDDSAEHAQTTPARIGFGRRVLAAGMTALAFGAVAQSLELLMPGNGMAAGLLSAAFIALLLGPIESLVLRITGAQDADPVDPATQELFQEACHDAAADGRLTRRERIYLKGLGERLGIDRRTRRTLSAQAMRTGQPG